MDEKTKMVFFEILRSHSQLAQAEYERNPSFNSSHFSHAAEEKAIELFREKGVLDEFLNYRKA